MMDMTALQALAEGYARVPSPEGLDAAAQAALPLCAQVARRFIGRGAEYDDLYQAACLACVRALRVYQPERGVPFAAFAAQYAGGAIRNYLRDQAAAVRLPRTLYEQGAQLTRARRELTMQLMREPTLSELAEYLSWDEARTLDTLLSLESGHGVSLDEEAGEGEISLHEMLGAEDQHITSAADYASVKALLDALPPRDARLLTLRYLENRSQRDTARALDMTQMQVHRAEKRLLALLRERLESK